MSPQDAPSPTTSILGSEEIRWQLEDLYPDQASLDQDLDKAQKSAEEFSRKYSDKQAFQDDHTLSQALQSLEEILLRAYRALSYGYLHWSTDTENPENGARLQRLRETHTRIQKKILFFELQWTQLSEKQAADLLEAVSITPYRHYLEVQRRRRPHLRSESEEKILAEKALTGRSAWVRFFDEILNATRFPFRGESLTSQQLLAKLYQSDREERRQAALSFTEGLRPRLRELTYVFNMVLADKSSDDTLRSYPHWLSSRNLDNEIEDEAVQALVDAVTSRYPLVARFYRLKARLLGFKELFDYDRYAPVASTDTVYTWKQATDLVLHAYGAFHPRMAEIASDFFEKSWIDAPPVAGKAGGAFSHQTVPTVHPYILMNYTGNIRDVQTLAHELGHGVHQYLSRRLGLFHCGPPLTVSETASVFGEMLVFEHLMKTHTQAQTRLSILMSKLDDTLATVFRQIAMHRFENQIHEARRQEGELTSERLGQIWIETQREMFQGSVTLESHYQIWWSYIPHFIHTPGYVYAYAFGELLVLALYEIYRREGSDFTSKYLSLLEAGGSDWPHDLMARFGVDLNHPDFWGHGLDAIEQLIQEAEDCADQL